MGEAHTSRVKGTAVAPFTLDTFTSEDPYASIDGVDYQRTRIEKTFTGALKATSTVEMLAVQGPDGAGAAYVAIESFHATLAGRTGTFALLHAGTMTAEDMWARWTVVDGSGTGELRGLTGEARIDIASDGAHTLHLDYEL
jgi:hypothetical protein